MTNKIPLRLRVTSQKFSTVLRSNLRNFYLKCDWNPEILEGCCSFYPFRTYLLLRLTRIYNHIVYAVNCRSFSLLSYVCILRVFLSAHFAALMQYITVWFTFIHIHKSPCALWSDARLSWIQKITFISRCYMTCKISSYFSIENELMSACTDIYINFFTSFFLNRYCIFWLLH